ncbi:hypothetical protein IFM46972_10433 [Aspergillus udagawae]|uniref:Alpha-L-arabinofuranosidase n=1 Tax=Aspergillus udagawae TaxID=91492 RepID=A0A8H3XPG8_9EURO|nr:hypothetical protein IFM46972_10433 [Aspergillus udagawae]
MFPRRAFSLGLVAMGSVVLAGPCDIYANGGFPCVAAHSTTRALYSAYTSALYQVIRGSDGARIDISPLSAGGVADANAQDTFCTNTTCLISIIYDQSGTGNHLYQAPPGYFSGPDVDGYDNMASAIGAPVTLNGQKAYGVFISPGTGYRNNNATGLATGDEAEGMYAVLDGTHYNDACCFDYGNAETSGHDTGNGHMEAIYYGNCDVWGTGSGSGPWIMADLENGLFSGESDGYNSGDPSISYRFVTTIIKGGQNQWAIRGANAMSGSLSTYYEGARPEVDGYNPMSKEGALVLGIGGDNSNGAQGTFYEGVITSGYPDDDTEAKVQADIVDAGYATTSLTSGPELIVNTTISLQVTTSGYTDRYLAHTGSTVNTQVVSVYSNTTTQQQASWRVRTGLGNSDCFSFESVDTPGSYIRHSGFELYLSAIEDAQRFYEDATFCPMTALSGSGNSVRSWSYPTRFIRHFNNVGYIASNGGVQTFDAAKSFNADASWLVVSGFAS